MKFAIYKTSRLALRKAGAAVLKNGGICKGFTLLEVMVVVIVIGILASLAYSSLMEVVSMNRAKETAQTLRTFAERALSEGKRLNDAVTITVNDKVIQYETTTTTPKRTAQELLGNGFSGTRTVKPTCEKDIPDVLFNPGATSQLKIGVSSIVLTSDKNQNEGGYFVACDARDYCGAAVKVKTKNSFIACIKRPKSTNWETL